MNLRKDPKRSPATLDIIRKSTREAEKLMPPLAREALGTTPTLRCGTWSSTPSVMSGVFALVAQTLVLSE
ncbi:hypothetical protein I6A84_01515 [Frankia sp. CNm7]|uniref:Uncharacterized protein n=1 Tax=Frankia nepalensis TaxID=1836974 RepID=A0A937RI89_9ACTN|nr:hypothetical protein [Frankia nepalensis]MBL7497979.1 hypothetical protein [Frankia nepalensis]MBL7509060.1 hypothetical protein [Frankia nepalensis]MBL7516837.1 hypothetical protein [Frankia nepalensis]MBL7627834.1 hypothetical protein [Frankia nepalensis]